MIELIRKLLGMGPKADLAEVLTRGAVIVDVRTAGEYAGGHLKNSVNMPLNELGRAMNKLDKEKPVITCCASGMRSASAKAMLKSNGFTEVHNGGSWMSLRKYDR